MELTHNCRVKRFPDGSLDIIAASSPFGGGTVVRDPSRYDYPELYAAEREAAEAAACPVIRAAQAEYAYEVLERRAIQAADGCDPSAAQAAANAAANKERARRRAAGAVRDLGLCNDFRWFVTLTLSPERVNRYDAAEVLRHLKHWLDNAVRRKGLAYVLVPEHHKDGAIHFHGFFNDALEAVDSGHQDGSGHRVYNLPEWGWGFSTAIELYGERRAAVAYVCKYIGKQGDKIGGRWYYSGGKLRRPEVVWMDTDFATMLQKEGVQTFDIPALPRTRFARLQVAAPAVPPGEGTEKRGATAAAQVPNLTLLGLSPRAENPCGSRAAVDGCDRMTPEKGGGKESTDDHGIPVEQGDGARSGGPHAAKCPHHADRFTDGAPHLGRAGASDGPAAALHVGGGKKDGQAAPLRPACAPAGGDSAAGGSRLGVPQPQGGAAQDAASRLGGREAGRQGVPAAAERGDP